MCLYTHGQILGQVSCHSKKQHSMRPLTFLKSRQQKELGWGAAGKRHLEVISQGTFTLFSTEGCQKLSVQNTKKGMRLTKNSEFF